MVNFMQKTNAKSFRTMVDSIKMGTRWRDALKEASGVTPAQPTAAFGRSVGIPNLQPYTPRLAASRLLLFHFLMIEY
jgi:hypothetical protein